MLRFVLWSADIPSLAEPLRTAPIDHPLGPRSVAPHEVEGEHSLLSCVLCSYRIISSHSLSLFKSLPLLPHSLLIIFCLQSCALQSHTEVILPSTTGTFLTPYLITSYPSSLLYFSLLTLSLIHSPLLPVRSDCGSVPDTEGQRTIQDCQSWWWIRRQPVGLRGAEGRPRRRRPFLEIKPPSFSYCDSLLRPIYIV